MAAQRHTWTVVARRERTASGSDWMERPEYVYSCTDYVDPLNLSSWEND